MKVKIIKPQSILLEGHIRLAFRVDEVIDIGSEDAAEAIRLGIAEPFTEAPAMEPQEKAVAAPNELKQKEADG